MSALGGGSVLHSCLMAHGLLRALSARIIKWQGRDTSPNAARASSSSSFPGIPQPRSVEARHMSRSSGASLPRERRSSSADMSQMQIAMAQRYQARILPRRSRPRKSHALKPKPDMNPTRFRKNEPKCVKQWPCKSFTCDDTGKPFREGRSNLQGITYCHKRPSAPLANANGAEGFTSHETKQIDARHRMHRGQSAVELSPRTRLEGQARRCARQAWPQVR